MVDLTMKLLIELIIKNQKFFFYEIPNHNGTKFSISSFLYIASNVLDYLLFKNNQILKDVG